MHLHSYDPISATLLVTLAGCGTTPAIPDSLQESTAQELTAVPPDDAVGLTNVIEAEGPPDAQTPNLSQAPADSNNPAPLLPENLGFPLSDIVLFPDLLSVFVDDLLLDLLQPSNPHHEISFLEQLCRDSDIPDFRCRQLYGD